jgi:ParB/RepB/Spo0J family partition protein
VAKKTKGRAAVEARSKKLERLVVEYVPVSSVSPNTYNPNRQSDHDFDLLKKSIDSDGFTQPVIVLRSSNQIVDGEHRWRAARDLGYEEIPVVFVDMTAEQMRVATLRHNRARGEEDIELSAQVLRDLRELGALEWAQDSLMLSDEEVNRLIEDVDVPEALSGDEYGEAWEPEQNRAGQNSEALVSEQRGGTTISSASSAEAIEQQRERERQIAEAKTEEEREKIRTESRVHRINLTFSGDEAELIGRVLRDRPAVRLAQIARLWEQHDLDKTYGLEG